MDFLGGAGSGNHNVKTPTMGGSAKHQMPCLAYIRAAAAQPRANAARLPDIRDSRARIALRESAGMPRIKSARSIITCVVLPVMMVVGGKAFM